MRSFTITQPALGALLQWTPPLGTAELDDLIDDWYVGPLSMEDKRSRAAFQFFSSFSDELLFTGPVTRTFEVGPKPGMAATRKTSGVKRGRAASPAQSISKRVPGFSILTKDGVDITEYASRGPKTKEQRDHAAMMRKLKACARCKKSKQRCDPSHHGVASATSSSSVTSPGSSAQGPCSTPSLSRASTSPYSALDDFSPQCPPSVNQGSPVNSPAMSIPEFFSTTQATDLAFARIEARRLALQQQQAELDAELAALQASSAFHASAAMGQASHNSYLESQPFTISSSPQIADADAWFNSFDFSPAGLDSVPSLVSCSSQDSHAVSRADLSRAPSSIHTGTLASPSRRRLASPDLDLDSFFNGLDQTASAVECHGDSPFDHNHRPEVQPVLQDFVLYPQGAISRWSQDREAATNNDTTHGPQQAYDHLPSDDHGLQPWSATRHSGAIHIQRGNHQDGDSLLTWDDKQSNMNVTAIAHATVTQMRLATGLDQALNRQRLDPRASLVEGLEGQALPRQQPLQRVFRRHDAVVSQSTADSNFVQIHDDSQLQASLAESVVVQQVLRHDSRPDSASQLSQQVHTRAAAPMTALPTNTDHSSSQTMMSSPSQTGQVGLPRYALQSNTLTMLGLAILTMSLCLVHQVRDSALTLLAIFAVVCKSLQAHADTNLLSDLVDSDHVSEGLDRSVQDQSLLMSYGSQLPTLYRAFSILLITS